MKILHFFIFNLITSGHRCVCCQSFTLALSTYILFTYYQKVRIHYNHILSAILIHCCFLVLSIWLLCEFSIPTKKRAKLVGTQREEAERSCTGNSVHTSTSSFPNFNLVEPEAKLVFFTSVFQDLKQCLLLAESTSSYLLNE